MDACMLALLVHQLLEELGQILLRCLEDGGFVGPEERRRQTVGPALAVIPCALNVTTLRYLGALYPFGSGAKDEEVIFVGFVQIRGVKVGAIGPSDSNRLAKLLPEVVQVKFKILGAVSPPTRND